MADRFRALTYVLRQESAFSLGTAGRKLRAAVEALHRWDSQHHTAHPGRTRVLLNAASALSSVVIQREALGMRDHAALIEEYGITPEIWHCIGVADSDNPTSAGSSTPP